MVKLNLQLKKSYDEDQLIFYAGGVIEGIAVELNGIIKCQNTMGLPVTHQIFQKRKEFLSQNLVKLAVGQYNYPFSIEIPYRLPQTNKKVKCKDFQHIRYNITAVFQPKNRTAEKVKQKFILKRCDYSNFYPALREPIEKECKKRFFGFCSVSDKVSIPYAGIAAGEIIPIKIIINNKSDVEITQTKIQLLESEVFYTRSYEWGNREDLLVESIEVGVKPNEYKEIIHELKVPEDVYMSDLLYAEECYLMHSIKVIANVKGLHYKMEVFIPIVLGKERFEGNFDDEQKINEEDSAVLVNFLAKKKFYYKLKPWCYSWTVC
ncbi:hypothetical protein PVAND_005217 [Polypedilum vanderplanki]|uniref:Arrestin C-terminal-like domain-containing protein n=1 Tax=Polypedilum vanderplanki TaxID=319348 RepID=A0A9J6BZ98_POLVA|nr:hypothetical protein PVAND_005217 [Polypedilum vanderplanki]